MFKAQLSRELERVKRVEEFINERIVALEFVMSRNEGASTDVKAKYEIEMEGYLRERAKIDTRKEQLKAAIGMSAPRVS